MCRTVAHMTYPNKIGTHFALCNRLKRHQTKVIHIEFFFFMVCRAIWNRKRKSNIEQRWIQLIFYVWMHSARLNAATEARLEKRIDRTQLAQRIRVHRRTQTISFPLVFKRMTVSSSLLLWQNNTCCTFGQCLEPQMVQWAHYFASARCARSHK